MSNSRKRSSEETSGSSSTAGSAPTPMRVQSLQASPSSSGTGGTASLSNPSSLSSNPLGGSAATGQTTMGGVQKKSFKPVVPARRKPKPTSSNAQSASSSQETKDASRQKERASSRPARGGRQSNIITNITSSAPFGLAAPTFDSNFPAPVAAPMIKQEQHQQHAHTLETKRIDLTDAVSVSDPMNAHHPTVLPLIPATEIAAIEPISTASVPTDSTALLSDSEDDTATMHTEPTSRSSRVAVKEDATSKLFTTPATEGAPNGSPLVFVHLPTVLPVDQIGSSDDILADDAQSSAANPNTTHIAEGVTLQQMLSKCPNGSIGKLRVHRSGAVSMQLGQLSFEVHSGVHPICRQELYCINERERFYASLGSVEKVVTVTPDLQSLLRNTKLSS